MSDAPTIDIIHSGRRSPRYQAAMAANRPELKEYGIDLGYADADLKAEAKKYAEEKQGYFAPYEVSASDIALDRWLYAHAQGEIGAELWARRYGCHAGWIVGRKDGGTDVVVWGTSHDIKTRQGLLTLEERHLAYNLLTVDYYVLIVQEHVTDPYVWGGVIAPLAFKALTEDRTPMRLETRGPQLRWARVGELIHPADYEKGRR